MRRFLYLCAAFGLLLLGLPTNTQAQSTARWSSKGKIALKCDDVGSGLCADTHVHKNYEGRYVGHDEPAIIFYSDKPGAGSSEVYLLTLPKDPPTLPSQDGKGGTWNFQLHPAFWAGMAICDSESFPEFTKTCNPATDANIADNADPNAPDFIGKHAGTAFLEMQLYPPGWVDSPQLIDPQNYFASMFIISFAVNGATGANNNDACLNSVGQEFGNFAVITKNGVPLTPPNPLGANFGQNNPDLNNVLHMAPGDQLLIILHDTPAGLEVIIKDLTSGDSGRMVASHNNGFGQVIFDPTATSCSVRPYDFHPMYSTSNEHTRVVWAAHSFNTAFSDEIGHFEFCNNGDNSFPFGCTAAGVNDTTTGLDNDDFFCDGLWDPSFPGPPFQQIGGCTSSELDFDGNSYGFNWAGTIKSPGKDKKIHSRPITFAGPLFLGTDGLHNYDRIGFETNVNNFEADCDFLVTGNGCVVPPPGVPFYPFYTTGGKGGKDNNDNQGNNGNKGNQGNEDNHGNNGNESICQWQEGGALIPGTTNTFGGSATTAYGPPLFLLFQTGPNTAGLFVNDNRQILDHNPCNLDFGDSFEGQMHGLLSHDK